MSNKKDSDGTSADTRFEELERRTIEKFKNAFGRDPIFVVTAPGRVNLIGEHTDYNDGFVFPMAIDRNVIIAADWVRHEDHVPSDSARIYSSAKRQPALVKIQGDVLPAPKVDWSEYVQGVIVGYLKETPSVQAPPFVAMIHSSVPLGAALSSSAALEVAVATLIEALTKTSLDPVRKALICQKAEHDFAKMPCGIMDQFISAMGKKDCLMLLDCKSYETKLIPFTSDDLSILIVNSRVKHQLSGSEYPERRASCFDSANILGVPSLRFLSAEQLEAGKEKLTETQYRRCRHVVGEIQRTVEAAEAIQNGEFERLGRLMYESHDSLRDDYEVSCVELDILVDICREIGVAGGVYGSRMTGGGFGGCTVSLIQSDKKDSIMETIERKYQEKTGISPEMFVTRPAEGARILQQEE
ncbi:MAG: galactokinase [Planctomycetia bacterium]|nr:galactokinase [Planctomycetia bacterium]